MNATTSITEKYNVTREQIDACERIIDLNRNEVFYIVESQSNPGTHYKVVYNRQFGCLQCLPFDGETCPASLKGIPCRHKRAAVAAAAEFKELKHAEREAERREVEATAEYQREQLEQAIAVAERQLAELPVCQDKDWQREVRAAERHEAAAVRRDGLKAYERKPFSLMH